MGEGATERTASVQVIGRVDGVEATPMLDAVALYRYARTASLGSEPLAEPTIQLADFVLRLNTVGGLGPDDEGAPCDPGSLDVPSEFAADFWFVEMPWSSVP
jgi:hypothetical protein